ncbi:hypothetical protein ACGE24_06460 [Corynebacterium kroppenstedtii]|uniref:hypothetical protein n=1 Tax=Corynebacterium sp. PCR 32 TaxID=3351342 RepID=UPI0030A92E3C
MISRGSDGSANEVDGLVVHIKSLVQQARTAAKEAADQRLAQETAYLKAQALQAREVQDARNAAQNQERTRRDQLTADMRALGANTLVNGEASAGPTPGFSGDIRQLRQSTIAAATVGGPAISAAAKTALASGRDADLKKFATDGYRAAASMDERAQLDQWWTTHSNEDVRFDSGYYANAAEDVVHWFATDGVE